MDRGAPPPHEKIVEAAKFCKMTPFVASTFTTQAQSRLGLSLPQILALIEADGPLVVKIISDIIALFGGTAPPAAVQEKPVLKKFHLDYSNAPEIVDDEDEAEDETGEPKGKSAKSKKSADDKTD